jgi:hypothetical protein
MMRDSENDELAEKGYNAYLVNRGLSYFSDTISLANEMNRYHFLDKKMQYEFLLHIVRKRKRFSKWFKKEENETLEFLSEYYNCSHTKAKDIMSVLTDDQISTMRENYLKGKDI